MDEVEEIMKLVKCIVRPDKVDDTTDALKQIDVSGVTVTGVGGGAGAPPPKGPAVVANMTFAICPK